MNGTAIDKALEHARSAGYNPGRDMVVAEILLDPHFWQAFGRALGWESVWATLTVEGDPSGKKNWEIVWHDFIDHLSKGKSAEEFFASLLAVKR